MLDEDGWVQVPLALAIDFDHGARWWSLTAGQREWLWTNPDGAVQIARVDAVPGDDFIDAGGGEECFPCVRGIPDHGDAWSRVWDGARPTAHVDTDFGRLHRTVSDRDGTLRIDYLVEPGEAAYARGDHSPTAPVTHAVHLLLELSDRARLEVPGARLMTVLDHPHTGTVTETAWPRLDGVDLSRLGPDDESVACAVLRGLAEPEAPAEAYVVDGSELLHLRWQADDPAAVGLMLWRNLGGWPAEKPYRSIGVEPLVEAAGEWWLEITAYAKH
ncbi:hypothetical protein CGZ93_10210 [Enemella dayhoffiae]|uniref:Uncharacterized protein n=1 Tax=Enemella dayhoffiae TaxID=2016507 RepID=A0A255H1C3_9ACTN|nr:hypothetical protein [Enemella dayhoffiae]OYO21505.1 hypothetical protein CGZ93_10210 [Enemella dayhoffiae]